MSTGIAFAPGSIYNVELGSFGAAQSDHISSGGTISLDGATVNVSAQVNPTDHLELALVQNQRWLNVDGTAQRGRVFIARVFSTNADTNRS